MPDLPPPRRPARPELLAPAGDRDCLRAAIENGADAVYFGLSTGFNARARATNFSLDELAEVMRLLHGRGVKGYVTLNTLVFPSELPTLEEHLREVARAGADAVLVQDLGVARLIRAICPELAMHASTQMTLTSVEGIEVARSLGIERVVLARELSLAEIRKIHAQTDMPLEAFVHGALCVAYSGQCLTSESLGGRSANRGQCAQACRLPYELVCDGRPVDLADYRYLLSPQDLAAYDLVPELMSAGVVSLKIEGRLKTPEYVANITRHYRQAIDAACAGQRVEFGRTEIAEMELSFSRGFSHGWLEGCDHKELVEGTSSDKRGVLVGQVRGVDKGRVLVELVSEVKRGDGIAFQVGSGDEGQIGGRIYEIFEGRRRLEGTASAGLVGLEFKHHALSLERLRAGQKVWKTDDPELTQRLRRTFAPGVPQRRMSVRLQVRAAVGEPLSVVALMESGASCRVVGDTPLAEAQRHALTLETLRDQLGRLGNTAYVLAELDAEIRGGPMAPFSELGKVRHQLVSELDRCLQEAPRRTVAGESVLAQLSEGAMKPGEPAGDGKAQIHVLARSLRQVALLTEQGVDSLYADFQDIREYGEAVRLAHQAGAKILLATPRIQKPGEAGIFRALLRHGADGMLARNLGGLAFYHQAGVPTVADFSLNCTNQLTARFLMERGAGRLTASYDLNREQLMDLVGAVPPRWLEVVIHQHMPMFHMEHCVFCAVLSPGTNKTNCGRPCDVHRVELKDRLGVAHPLTADVGCRNTLFNAVPQSAAEAVPALLSAGILDFRVELVADPAPEELAFLLASYRDLLQGKVSGKEVWTRLKAANRVGVTRGTLEERRNPLAIL